MSTPAHTRLSVHQFLTKNGRTPVPHPPYSPDLAPRDQKKNSAFFLLFPQIKKGLKGKPFADVEEVKQELAEALKDTKIDEFKNCFE